LKEKFWNLKADSGIPESQNPRIPESQNPRIQNKK
jgi:hypothetical protein